MKEGYPPKGISFFLYVTIKQNKGGIIVVIIVQNLFVGLPKTVGKKDAKDPMEREWTSAIFKVPVDGPVWLSKTHLAGDGQADLKHHGGPEKAVFVYPSEHYDYWQKEMEMSEMKSGGMGENFSTIHITEESISIGDTFRVGDAIVQVSQPRQPCWKPARRFKRKDLALLIQKSGKTGWYFRVLKEGYVKRGDVLERIDRPCPEWTIARCNYIMHVDKNNLEAAKQLAECKWLAPNWRETLRKRVEKNEQLDVKKRLIGPNE